jgi:two-component system, OmpR family, sensor kinase
MPRSLRARLSALVAGVVLLAVALTFAVVYHYTGSQLKAQIDRSVRSGAAQLAHAMTERPSSSARGVLTTARRYVATQPYTGSALLLFVLIPGVGRASNHPELFGTDRPEDGESAAEQARENRQGQRLARPRLGYSSQLAPDTGMLRMFQVRFSVDGRAAYAGAAEPLESADHAQEVVAHSFELAGALALVLAMLAAYAVGSRITGPIRRSAAVAARIDGGDLTPRISLPRGTSGELETLAEALNHMLDRLESAFAAQREFVADASHELRTPLTVLRGQLDLLVGAEGEADGSLDRAEVERVERLMQSEIARLSRLVDDLLLLAQSDRDDFLHVSVVALDELVTELWDGLSLIAQRNFEIGALPALTVRADPDRLAQALRNLARNAIAHTRAPNGLVRIDVSARGNGIVRITVSDDGPGVPSEARQRVFERFYRTDAARTRSEGGAGLGLAIVRAIADAHHGSVRVTKAPSGGAAFELDLPTGR